MMADGSATSVAGLMTDDHLLRDFLVDEVPMSVRELLLDAPGLMTTDLMVVRLAGAVFKERRGHLTGLLSDEQERVVVDALLELPPEIRLWTLSEAMLPSARLMVEYSITLWVALGLVGAKANSLYFGADERNVGRNLFTAAGALEVPVLLVDHESGVARIVKP